MVIKKKRIEKMLCCNNCIINPICKVGCEKLSGDLNIITLEDFIKYENLNKRLILVKQLIGRKNLILDLDHDIKFKVNSLSTCLFFKKNKFHREDGPAIEYINGNKYWYKNGKCHREDGPAVEYINGNKQWYKNGKLHRVDGPSTECANNGNKYWHINGKLHREDGPAIEYTHGNKYWYINGKILKKEVIN